MAGFKVVWANEFVPAAAETYRLNSPDTILDTRSIRDVTGDDVLKATGLEVGELDLFDGSPPCQSFSTAGKREQTWGKVSNHGDHTQRNDDLFFEYVRLLRALQPRTFIAENVSGLVAGVAKGYFFNILAELKESGYRVVAKLLDAQWLGVPQSRPRVIFAGVRNDLGFDPVHPRPFPYRYTLRDALAAPLPESEPDWMGLGQASTLLLKDVRPGQYHHKRFNLGRADWNRPSPCVMAMQGTAGLIHPDEDRRLGVRELRRVCSFPDDFQFTGKLVDVYRRFGNAVPPLMMAAVAACVRDNVLLAADRKQAA